MNKMTVKRATNDQQKEARREAILKAARALFLESGFFDVNMASIAKRSGLAKGTVYLYFQTKEEIFLTLSTEEFENWLDMFDEELINAGDNLEIETFLVVLKRVMHQRDVMKRLVSLLHLVLEKNISFEEAFAFKMNLKKRSEKTSELIEKALPFLKSGQGIDVLTTHHCLMVGFGQMSDPSPVLSKVLEHPELAAFRVDLEERLVDSMFLFLTGLKCRSEGEADLLK